MVAADEVVPRDIDDLGVLKPEAGGVKGLGDRAPYRFFFGRRIGAGLFAAGGGA